MKKVFKFLFLAILALALAFSAFYITKKYIVKKSDDKEQKEEVKKEKEKEKVKYPIVSKASMVMTGDALIHNSVFKDAALGDGNYDFTKQMTYISPIIKTFDLAFYNQETIIGGKDLGISTYPLFNSPDEIGDCMIGMGFNMVNLASNHTLDKGEKGILHSVGYWRGKDALTAGQYDSEEDRNEIRVKEKNGIKYTLLAYTVSTNGIPVPQGKDYLVNVYSDEKAKADIERVKDKVDVIFVSMHWGTEYYQGADDSQKRIAKYLSDLGVNVIIGTGPHVLEPIEYINNTLVVYSLGNYISAQIGVERLTGALVSLNVVKTINEDQTSTVEITDPNAHLIYTSYKNTPSYWSDFRVIPYEQLTDDILPGYRNYYEKYSAIIKQYDSNIGVTSLE